MSEILYNTNKLSRDICSVINKYLDFSLDNFKKKFNKTCIEKSLTIKSDITLDDILMKCTMDGCIGFFVNKCFMFNSQLEKLYNSSINKENIIKKDDGYIKYLLYDEGFCCDILRFLEIFEITSL
jgi:hypothetical protein